MELTLLNSLLPIFSAILGYAISHFFFPKTITVVKEVIKEVIKEVPVEVVKIVEVKRVVNQCQVAEVVIEGNEQYLKAWDYYNRKQVISKMYGIGALNHLKNGDVLLYLGTPESAELELSTVSPA